MQVGNLEHEQVLCNFVEWKLHAESSILYFESYDIEQSVWSELWGGVWKGL